MILPRAKASKGFPKGQISNDVEGRVVVPSYSVEFLFTAITSLMQRPDEEVHVVDDYRLLLSHYTSLSVRPWKSSLLRTVLNLAL